MVLVEYTDEFGEWWDELGHEAQKSIAKIVNLLRVRGIQLGYPYSSGIKGSRHSHMRELRIQHQGSPYRVLYAFDPRRAALLLIGGEKTDESLWYSRMISLADDIYDQHLNELEDDIGEEGN